MSERLTKEMAELVALAATDKSEKTARLEINISVQQSIAEAFWEKISWWLVEQGMSVRFHAEPMTGTTIGVTITDKK